MTLFSQLSDPWQGVLCLLGLLGFFLFLYDLLRSLQLGERRMVLPAACALALSFCHLQVMIMNAYRSPYYPFGIRLPAAETAAVCAGFAVLGGFWQYRISRWSRSNLSAMSLKEAFDRLPAGLCYYLPGGLLKLVDLSMDALCTEALGAPLMDPEGFWQALTGGSLPISLRGGESPVLRLADGRVFSFRHRVLSTEFGPVHELLAMDVTEDWELNRELEWKQERAKELNVRLKALLGSIEYLTMSRELMQLKAQLHDTLGQTLLLSRRCLSDPESVDPETVRQAWLEQLRRLENSRPETWQQPYYIQQKQAEALGVTLKISGSLPAERRLIPVVETALSVHVTNLLRHAGGRTAFVCCEPEGNGYRLIFTGDGAPPAGPVREGGGLSNLRSLVEALGGSMELSSAPVFRLRLWLPAGEEIL